MKKTIIFDFGGVLLDIDISLTIQAFQQLHINIPNQTDIHPNNAGIFLAQETGDISTRQFLNTLRSYAPTDAQPTDEQILNAWCALLLPFKWERFAMLDQLRKTYRVMLLSNTNEAHHNHFEASFNSQNPEGRTFRSYFDEVFYSDELHLRKPNIEIYEKVQTLGGLTPNETLFVDDNSPNLEAPRRLGWHTLHKPADIEILGVSLAF